MASRKKLTKLNAPVVAKPIKRALTDRQVRALAAGAPAETAVESTLRQSRRVSADYNAQHVHVPNPEAADPTRPQAPAPDKIAVKALKEETTRTQAAEGRAGAERAAQSADLESKASGSARESFGDGRGHENTTDSENAAPSAGESLPFVGPRYRQTERAANARTEATDKRDQAYDKLAWQGFERDHPAEAAAFDKVRERETEATRELVARGKPDDAFALMLDSWIKKNVRDKPGARARRQGELLEDWRKWSEYLTKWRRDHPEAQLPDRPSLQPRYGGSVAPTIAAAVHAGLYGRQTAGPMPLWRAAIEAYERELRAAALVVASDPLVTDWGARGMPLGRGDIRSPKPWARPLFTLKSLETRWQEIDADWWSRNEFAQRVAKNNAKRDFEAEHARYRPRSLLDVQR